MCVKDREGGFQTADHTPRRVNPVSALVTNEEGREEGREGEQRGGRQREADPDTYNNAE